MPGFVGICWIVTAIAACLSGFVLIIVLKTANGAPQEASGAAIALAVCIIPYVFTRAWHAFAEMNRLDKMLDQQKEMLDRDRQKEMLNRQDQMLVVLKAIRYGEEVTAAHEIIERTGA